MRTTLAIFPHLDDAALSAGQFLAGRPDVVVVTVLAGIPEAKQVLTTYDRQCGFPNAEVAVVNRRAENEEALAYLGCKPVNLEYVDSQYGQGPANQEAIAATISDLVEQYDPEFVLGPLGLVHPDHELVREAFLQATTDAQVPVWLCADLPSRVTHPESARSALDAIHERGLELERGFLGDGPLADKMAALWSYRSQLGLFPNHHELLGTERFWLVKKKVENQ